MTPMKCTDLDEFQTYLQEFRTSETEECSYLLKMWALLNIRLRETHTNLFLQHDSLRTASCTRVKFQGLLNWSEYIRHNKLPSTGLLLQLLIMGQRIYDIENQDYEV